ncbi:hypothetical protein EJB05_41683, partial [Eragrostis curvula]
MRSTSKLPLLATISLLLLLLFVPSTAAARVGPVATNKQAIDASGAQRLELPDNVFSPESVAFDEHGVGPYVSASDGRVLRWDGEADGWKTFAYSPGYANHKLLCGSPSDSDLPSEATESLCGRPLGLRFHNASGDLYIADAYMGLMRVGKDGGEATVLATEANGVPFKFTNGVDVDQATGDVYFSDSSTTYTRADHQKVSEMHDSTGRILKYNPRTNQVTVLQSGLPYPNGVAISSDRTHLIVALTGPCKLHKFWLTGPKAGKSETFAYLRGYPDNVRQDGNGGYWVAFNMEKIEYPRNDKHMIAIRIGGQGEKLQEIRGPKTVSLSEVVQRQDGKLYFGSVERSFVGIFTSS